MLNWFVKPAISRKGFLCKYESNQQLGAAPTLNVNMAGDIREFKVRVSYLFQYFYLIKSNKDDNDC